MVNIADFSGKVEERIGKAIDALGSQGGEIIFPPGRYHFERELTLTGKSHIRFIGHEAVIDGKAVRSYFDMNGCSNISFEGFHFDARVGLLPTYRDFADGIRQTPIRFMNSQGLTIRSCRFANLYTVFVYAYGSTDIGIAHCQFSSPLQNQNQYLSFVEFLTCGGAINIEDNLFCGAPTTVNDKSPAAVAASGLSGSLRISGNRAQHCGRNNGGSHRLACFDLYSDTVNVTVAGNTALNCREQFMRISTSVNVVVDQNFVTTAAEADGEYSTLSVESGSWPKVANPVCKNIRITDNNFLCYGNRQAFAIGVSSYDWGGGAENVRIEGNSIQRYDRAFYVAGPFRDLTIVANRAKDVRAFLDLTLAGEVPMTSILGTERSSAFDGLIVEGNEAEITPGSKIVPVSFSIGQARRYAGSVGQFVFRRNLLSGASPGTAIAVNCIFNTSTKQGRLEASNNRIRGYATPFYLRSIKQARVADNVVEGMTSLYLTDGTVQSLETLRNRR